MFIKIKDEYIEDNLCAPDSYIGDNSTDSHNIWQYNISKLSNLPNLQGLGGHRWTLFF